MDNNGATSACLSRYLLRPFFADESWDRKKGGSYNARRDKLSSSWRAQFGKNHALIIIDRFYENVSSKDYAKHFAVPKGAGENLEICFEPKSAEPLLVPCIYDTWAGGEDSLHSFALITDEPPAEVLRTGHDRCPIFLTKDAALRWLRPEGLNPEQLFEILDTRATIAGYPSHAVQAA